MITTVLIGVYKENLQIGHVNRKNGYNKSNLC